jgi:dihydroneopterin aldolase
MSSDTVLIEGLQVDALVGVYAHERDAMQPLLLDIELAYDNRRAAGSDAVADTVDYAAVCDLARQFIAQREPQLLETLAEALAAQLLCTFETSRVRLRIRKPLAAQALGAASVGVEIERTAHRS